MLVGPKRSGKGTVGRVLTALLGKENVAAPTLASLGQNFGLQPLIDKQAAIISDARLGNRSDQQVTAERLLSISGEDYQNIDRKYREAWFGQLAVRFLILTNELPRIADASGALAGRFIILALTESFFGQEDVGLTNRLLKELPGILNWSLDGLARLNQRGHFLMPQSAQEAVRQLEDLGSPIGAFLREKCVVGTGRRVAVSELFAAWQAWCEGQGGVRAGTKQTFGRDLRAALPAVKIRDGGGKGATRRSYDGICLVGPEDTHDMVDTDNPAHPRGDQEYDADHDGSKPGRPRGRRSDNNNRQHSGGTRGSSQQEGDVNDPDRRAPRSEFVYRRRSREQWLARANRKSESDQG
jgi:putative DNA primase/helicase